jgi:RTA1 like protein
VGYAGRFLGNSDPSALGPFIIQTLCLLVAPTLFAASIYMVLGRLITMLHAEPLSPVRPRWLTNIFVGGDIVSFVVQLAGAGMLSSASNFSLGKTIILVGVVVQILFFGLFVVAGGVFHVRLLRNPTPVSLRLDSGPSASWIKGPSNWRGVLYALYAVSLLIFVRSLFRLIEYTGGSGGPLLTQEVWLYVFDSVLMLGVMVILILQHPNNFISNRASKHLSGEELL